jgi:Ohr subfamily peroxiredoxin
VLYTGQTDTIGGRENGFGRSSDGVLDIRFSAPGSMGIGTNPEQLLAAGWSASLASAIALVALRRKFPLPGEVRIHAEVSLIFDLKVYAHMSRLTVALPGVERSTAEVLLEEAIEICPISKAFRRACDVTIELA